MEKVIHCRDVGMDCNYVVRGKSEEEVMEKTAEHVRDVHNIEMISPALAQKVQASVRDE